MANVLNWFEIPATDLNRAVKFYSEILGGEFHLMDMMELKMALFPMEGEGVGGALCQGEWYKPTQDGAVIYLNANPDLSVPLSKVESAGGKIIMPKKHISDDIGYMALFIDSEGNKVAFHSNK
ncbi:MAG: VOC family protein [Melioribacteraceae bacterium]|nr:VOC family protein [Melioribacteraceae bacterium]